VPEARFPSRVAGTRVSKELLITQNNGINFKLENDGLAPPDVMAMTDCYQPEKTVEKDGTDRRDVTNPGTLEGFRTKVGGGVSSIRCC